MELYTSVGRLAALMSQSQIAIFDVETSGLDPRRDVLAGCGFYLPELDAACYLNTGHFIQAPDFPKVTEQELTAAIRPFFADPNKHIIGHNLQFDLRFLFSIGVTDVRCRTTCTLIMQHRNDENLREKAVDFTTHPSGEVGFGLKKLIRIFWNEVPPTILEATGGMNTLAASPSSVAKYCVTDCRNTWRVYQRNLQLMDSTARWLLENIDDPTNLTVSKMLWQGLGIDMEEASHQVGEYEQAIEICREEIWNTLGDPKRPLFDKPKKLKRLLSNLLGTRVFSITGETLRYLIKDVATTERQRKIIAMMIVWKSMRQRLSSFLRPLPEKAIDGRIYASRFSSTLVTTRFSSSPNLQNMPKRADKVSEEDDWLDLVPERCKPALKTRNVITAAPGCVLIELDYSAAEPRYLASVFQRAITEKDTWYRNERNELRWVRESRYGQLMQQMKRTQKKDKKFVSNEIVWPTYQEDPLWRVFKYGIPTNDPYNALLSVICRDEYLVKQAEGEEVLDKWFEKERWRGKRAWLALAYGSKAASLAPKLKWTVERTQEAIVALETTYAMLPPMRELTLRSVLHLGKVKTLWGRMRRLNGFYQLTGIEPVKVRFHYAGQKSKWSIKSPVYRYEAEIVPLGSWRRGIQCFVKDCWLLNKDGTPDVSVLRGTDDGMIEFIEEEDCFVSKDHFNRPPFRNLPFSQIDWVQEANGLIRHLGRQEHAERQAFNFLAQGCGADHLRTTMNAIDAEICTLENYRDCRLVLSIHDSLVYEVSEAKATEFIAAITPVARRRPDWCDFDIKISVEVGRRMGELKPA